MRKPRACTKCGVERKLIIEGAKVRQQGYGKAGPHSKNKALYFTIVTLAPLCIPCLLETVGLKSQAKFSNLPKFVKEDVYPAEGEPESAQSPSPAHILTRQQVRRGVKLTAKEIKGLEKAHGKHHFCYQCGSTDLEGVDDQHLHPGLKECRNCGSSDLDGG